MSNFSLLRSTAGAHTILLSDPVLQFLNYHTRNWIDGAKMAGTCFGEIRSLPRTRSEIARASAFQPTAQRYESGHPAAQGIPPTPCTACPQLWSGRLLRR